ncbi:MAG: response regulator transcription factor [Rubrivivax sp.]|nr:response regulator transcription factor [Rubrivivax sp.]
MVLGNPCGRDLEIDVPNRRIWRGGQLIGMTPREWLVVEALLLPNCLIWAESELVAFMAHGGVVSSVNAVRIHLCNIRRKLGWEVIQTLPGRGYRIVSPPLARAA